MPYDYNSCDNHHTFPLMMDHRSLNCEPKQILFFFFLVAFVAQQLEKELIQVGSWYDVQGP